MTFKLLVISSIFTSAALASDINFDYKTKEVFSLAKRGETLKEINHSRVEQSRASVTLKHQGKIQKEEKYNVQISKEDKGPKRAKLSLKLNNSLVTIQFGNNKVSTRIKNDKIKLSSEQTSKLIKSALEQDIKYLVRGIDKNISSDEISTSLKKFNFHCENIKSHITSCYLEASSSTLVDRNRNPLDKLKGHFSDLRKEMVSNISVNYDIEGYREFLNKSEEILKKSLKATKKQDIVKELISLKQIIVDERIDSYEYTAIRAKSIVSFVDNFLTKLDTTKKSI